MLQYNFRQSISTNHTTRTTNTATPRPPSSDDATTTTRNQQQQHRRQEQRFQLSRRVATQAILYQFSFFITWIFPMVQFVVSFQTGDLYFPILVLTVIFTPLQGFGDALIYFRPRYLRYRQQQQQQQQEHERRRRNSDPRSPPAPAAAFSTHSLFMARRLAILQALSQPPELTTTEGQPHHLYEGEIIYADDGETVGAWESSHEERQEAAPCDRDDTTTTTTNNNNTTTTNNNNNNNANEEITSGRTSNNNESPIIYNE